MALLFGVDVLTFATGNYVEESAGHELLDVVLSTPQLQSYAVHKLYFCLREGGATNAVLCKVRVHRPASAFLQRGSRVGCLHFPLRNPLEAVGSFVYHVFAGRALLCGRVRGAVGSWR